MRLGSRSTATIAAALLCAASVSASNADLRLIEAIQDRDHETVRTLLAHEVDVNARDHNGYNALHHAASRGDVEMIRYLAERGTDVLAVSRRGQTTADMANGPYQRTQPFPDALELLESLGAHNNNNCVSC